MATTSFSNWDFSNYHVQAELKGGQFVSAETSLIAAGPPELQAVASGQASTNAEGVGTVYPIGLIENAGVSQSKQLQRVFEIGSSRSYFIPGRVVGSLSLGRIFYYGPSLLRVMYAYYRNTTNNILIGTKASDATVNVEGGTAPDPLARLLNSGGDTFHALRQSPGEDYFFVNLASDLFNQPTGIAFYFKDASYNSVGAFYLENLYIQGHQFSVSSGSVMVMEGASAQWDRCVPIKVIL